MEDTRFWLFIAAGGVFFFGVVVYLAFMIFLPEWVGITGKVALEAERSHREGEAAGDDVIDKMHKRKGPKNSLDASRSEK